MSCVHLVISSCAVELYVVDSKVCHRGNMLIESLLWHAIFGFWSIWDFQICAMSSILNEMFTSDWYELAFHKACDEESSFASIQGINFDQLMAFDTNLVLYFKNLYNTDVGVFHFSNFTIRYSTDGESRLEYQESTIKMLEELFNDQFSGSNRRATDHKYQESADSCKIL